MSAIDASVLSDGRPQNRRSVALAWSGGKDSALALRALRHEGCEVAVLMTTVTETYDRVSMHGVRRTLLRLQAGRVGIPLVEVSIPPDCVNAVYEQRLATAFSAPPLSTVGTVAFGDLFLEHVRAYREERLAAAGRGALFPLWGRDTGELAREFVADGFDAVVCCVDPRRLDRSFAGSAYDADFLARLPRDVDPCGERGEFHTFVRGGPVFSAPVPCRTGKKVERDGFVFADLVPSHA